MKWSEKCKNLILKDRTQQTYGYDPESLTPGSSRPVLHKCDVCGLEKKNAFCDFIKETKLSHNQCSRVKYRATCLAKYGVDNVRKAEVVKERIKSTIKEKYGVDNASQSVVIKDKKRLTTQKHYGVDNPYQSKEIQEKLKQIHQERLGVDNPSQAPQVKEKRKQTCLERFGVEYSGAAKSVQRHRKQTCLEKFGVEYALQSYEIQEKIKQVLQKRYGVVRVCDIPGILEKRRDTCLELYGVSSPSLLPENRNRLKEWCTANPEKCFTPKAEVELLEWVQQLYPEAQKYKDSTYEIDIFIPSIQLGIEHNGLFWHAENQVGKRYHLNKTQYFQDKGIRIVHIFEHEWKFRQNQVKSFLLSALGKNQFKIGARKCDISWSLQPDDIGVVEKFLDEYHIQGAPQNTKCVVQALYNNDLIAVATFGKHHRNNKDWVLTRFCTKTNYTIQGVLSRISKLASKQLKEDIISWADYRLSNGNGYEQAGWQFEKLLPPDYFYHKGSCKVISKQSRQKRCVKTPKEMTEREHAEQDGLHRVYDCGKLRYRFKYIVN